MSNLNAPKIAKLLQHNGYASTILLASRITRGSAGHAPEPKDEAMVRGSDCNHLLGGFRELIETIELTYSRSSEKRPVVVRFHSHFIARLDL